VINCLTLPVSFTTIATTTTSYNVGFIIQKILLVDNVVPIIIIIIDRTANDHCQIYTFNDFND